jgi:hypothetical protein
MLQRCKRQIFDGSDIRAGGPVHSGFGTECTGPFCIPENDTDGHKSPGENVLFVTLEM